MFSDSDFKSMTFPIHGKKDLKKVAELKLVEAFTRIEEDKDSKIRYLCYMYDKGSPLPRRYKALKKRKEECLRLAGVSSNQELYKNLIDLTTQDVSVLVDCIHQMLIVQKDRVWSMIIADETLFNENLMRMLRPVEMDKDKDVLASLKIKSEISKIQEEVNNRLDASIDKFYGDDPILADKVEKLRYSPESIANSSR